MEFGKKESKFIWLVWVLILLSSLLYMHPAVPLISNMVPLPPLMVKIIMKGFYKKNYTN